MSTNLGQSEGTTEEDNNLGIPRELDMGISFLKIALGLLHNRRIALAIIGVFVVFGLLHAFLSPFRREHPRVELIPDERELIVDHRLETRDCDFLKIWIVGFCQLLEVIEQLFEPIQAEVVIAHRTSQ